jgi:hypothetical protein
MKAEILLPAVKFIEHPHLLRLVQSKTLLIITYNSDSWTTQLKVLKKKVNKHKIFFNGVLSLFL